MKERLAAIYTDSCQAIKAITQINELEELRVKVLGRKGELTTLLRDLKSLSPEQRPAIGQAANEVKTNLTRLFDERIAELKRTHWMQKPTQGVDYTLPGKPDGAGRFHILNSTMQEIEAIFTSMGFCIVEGPEVETDYYNFEAMNFPANHPARDMQDTFFISEQVLLRTHTSPVQVRLMEQQPPPIRAIMPGKTYRCDDDATHSPMFHQVEGLLIDQQVSLADLKGTLTLFVQRMFGPAAGVRFRPSFFPFTEPSAEVDMTCVKCQGKGCPLCKGTGWIEILGAGMVHPNVLKAGKIDPQIYTGFAFGMGVERVAMVKYGIDNMRYFFENDLRFLNQF